MTKLIKTDNWVHALVEVDRFNKWFRGWLDVNNGMVDNYIQWGVLYEKGKPELAEKARAKYIKFVKLVTEYPEWHEEYEFDYESMQKKYGKRNNTL